MTSEPDAGALGLCLKSGLPREWYGLTCGFAGLLQPAALPRVCQAHQLLQPCTVGVGALACVRQGGLGRTHPLVFRGQQARERCARTTMFTTNQRWRARGEGAQQARQGVS